MPEARRYVVAGAPCSGKSTFVGLYSVSGDLIYDYDVLLAALSGQGLHQHSVSVRPYVLAARDAIFQEVARRTSQSCWLITATRWSAELSRMRNRFDAEVVLLSVDRDEAHRRCDRDGRPDDWHNYIDRWFDESDIDPIDWPMPDMEISGRSNMADMEIRSFTIQDLGVETENDQRLIRGYAAVFGHESRDLGGFREVIEPGFFDPVLGDDVRSLWNHNDDYVLGRTRSGTLRISADQQGLRFEADAPETTWADDALVSIRRGDVDRASFGFRVRKGGDSWEQRSDGTVVRRLLPGGCERLFDVSPVTFPAYEQTSVEARSMAKQFDGESRDGRQEPPASAGDDERDAAQVRAELDRLRLDLAEAENRPIGGQEDA